MSRGLMLFAGALALAACHRSSPDNSVDITRACSTRVRSKGAVPRLPRAPSPGPGVGAVIGTLADAGGALPHYPILAVIPGDDPQTQHATAIPDSSGGFSFAALRPGHYRMFVRAYAHRPDSTDVEVRAGNVDTLSIVMQLYDCLGR